MASDKGQSLRVFWLFTAAVVILIAISLVFKFITLIATSSFDGKHRFTLAILEQPVRILSFAPDAQTLSVLTVTKVKNPTKNDIETITALPIDAVMQGSENKVIWKTEKDQKTNIQDILQTIFFHSPQERSINVFDCVQLWIFTQSLTSQSFLTQTFSADADAVTKEQIIIELFSDHTLSKESKSIQVVNGTGISGFGNSFALRLTNIGGNVVSVTTSPAIVSKTTIQYYGQSSYTVEKIEKIVRKKARKSQKQTISDIIIILGKDITGE